jgi:hypothetical protein
MEASPRKAPISAASPFRRFCSHAPRDVRIQPRVVADCNNSARCSTCACQHPFSTEQIVQSCLCGLPFFQKTPCSIADRIRPGGRRLPISPRGRPESAWPFAHWANAVFFGPLALSKSHSRSARSQEADTALSLSDVTITEPTGSYGLRVSGSFGRCLSPRVAAFGQSRPTRHGAHRALPPRH